MDYDAILKEFTKPELVKIANELEIDLPDKATSTRLIININADLTENGIPEEDDCSDLLEDFLWVAGFIADDEDDETEEEVEEEPVPEPVVEESALPDCYGCADERDPSCKRCKVFTGCMAERVSIRERELECFGKLFDINAQECGHCLEAGPCKIALRDVKVV